MLRFGIIGTGAIGLEHIRNIAIIENACVAAIADTNAQSRQLAIDTLGGSETHTEVYSDYAELLADSSVDAVIICTPNYHHIQVIRAVVPTGKHILCEKPLCTTLEDCREAEELLVAYPAVFWVGMEYRFIPSISQLIKEVKKDTIGKLRMLSIREHRFPFLKKVADWNRLSCNTGGTLVEKCCHFFDLMAHIIGAAPLRVMASGGQDVNHLDEVYNGQNSDILDNAYVIVEWENGTRSSLDLCMFAEASVNQEELVAVGDKGKIEAFAPSHSAQTKGAGASEADQPPNFVLGLRNPEIWAGPPTVKPPDMSSNPPLQKLHLTADQKIIDAGYHMGATYFELMAFVDAVLGGQPPAVTVRDGTLAVAIGIAAHMSIEEGRAVPMNQLLGSPSPSHNANKRTKR